MGVTMKVSHDIDTKHSIKFKVGETQMSLGITRLLEEKSPLSKGTGRRAGAFVDFGPGYGVGLRFS